MMIKSNGEYFDFDGEIEIESQVKLFEEIETANGDYSYAFDLPKTSKNLSILGLPFPDTVKSIYSNVPCEIIDDSGFKIYRGSLEVNTITKVISCTFYGGNADWFGLLTNPLASLPLYRYDVDLTEANIQSSWTVDSGIVFPILDAGALVSRSYANFKVEDFTAEFYVKTLFLEIFNPQGIKLQGDLIDDPIYNSLTIASNGKREEDIRARSSYVNKTTTQNNISVLTKITFQDETNFPYFDGSLGNFNNSTYTADVRMRVDTDWTFFADGVGGLSVFQIEYYINGSYSGIGFSYAVNDTGGTTSKSQSFLLEAGDTLEFYVEVTGLNNVNIRSGNIKITPTYIYRVFGNSSVPAWTQGEFVSNILRLFNALPSFNADTKTLTIDLFEKIKEKDPIDVSDDVVIVSTDFSEFVSGYGKNNHFKYQEGSDEDLRKYNISNFVSYGDGIIPIENDFIQREADVVESDFTAPITYLNGVFDTSMERINFVELEEIDDYPITSVADSAGTPRFNIADADEKFIVGDLVGFETVLEGYSGEWVVASVTTTYITVNGLGFTASTTGTATLLRHKFTTESGVYLFINVPNLLVSSFSSANPMLIENTTITTAGLSYFNLLSNGRLINKTHKQSLSFGEVNNPLAYQLTILDTYWKIFEKVLSDPVMLTTENRFKRAKFDDIKTFLRPLRVKTVETNNLYYLNNHRGYSGGVMASEGKLIKL